MSIKIDLNTSFNTPNMAVHKYQVINTSNLEIENNDLEILQQIFDKRKKFYQTYEYNYHTHKRTPDIRFNTQIPAIAVVSSNRSKGISNALVKSLEMTERYGEIKTPLLAYDPIHSHERDIFFFVNIQESEKYIKNLKTYVDTIMHADGFDNIKVSITIVGWKITNNNKNLGGFSASRQAVLEYFRNHTYHKSFWMVDDDVVPKNFILDVTANENNLESGIYCISSPSTSRIKNYDQDNRLKNLIKYRKKIENLEIELLSLQDSQMLQQMIFFKNINNIEINYSMPYISSKEDLTFTKLAISQREENKFDSCARRIKGMAIDKIYLEQDGCETNFIDESIKITHNLDIDKKLIFKVDKIERNLLIKQH